MQNHQRTLVYIFARDFSLWVNELIRHAYVEEFPLLWGRGLEDQIVHFDGRTARWYRYEDDYAALRDFMVRQPLTHVMLKKEGHVQFRKDVDALRKAIASPLNASLDRAKILREITQGFARMYPHYTFSVFLAGAWRDQFLAVHGERARPFLDMVYESRTYSEGLVKETDLFIRKLVGPILKEWGLPVHYGKLLRKEEIEACVFRGGRVKTSTLEARAQGYVSINNGIELASDFNKFLSERNLARVEEAAVTEEVQEFSGTVACRGSIIRAPVQIIFNSEEVNSFRSGSILVTPMTSPEYLSAMKTAAAIVTDEGGLTCHAAIVSRELGIPCIIGTKFATKVLKDGDRVEVNAMKGIVRKI